MSKFREWYIVDAYLSTASPGRWCVRVCIAVWDDILPIVSVDGGWRSVIGSGSYPDRSAAINAGKRMIEGIEQPERLCTWPDVGRVRKEMAAEAALRQARENNGVEVK